MVNEHKIKIENAFNLLQFTSQAVLTNNFNK